MILRKEKEWGIFGVPVNDMVVFVGFDGEIKLPVPESSIQVITGLNDLLALKHWLFEQKKTGVLSIMRCEPAAVQFIVSDALHPHSSSKYSLLII